MSKEVSLLSDLSLGTVLSCTALACQLSFQIMGLSGNNVSQDVLPAPVISAIE